MARFPQRIWLAAFLAAWAVDFLFWQKPVGISFPIFVVLALAGAFVLARMENARPARFSLVLALLILLFSVVTVLRAEPFSRFINSFLAFSAVGLLVVTFRSGEWVRFRVLDYFFSGILLIGAGVGGAAGLRLAPQDGPDKTARATLRRAVPVVRGLVLALPVVFLLGALLASADLVFENQLKSLFEIFNLEKLPEYIFRLFYILFLGYVFAGLYRHALVDIPWLMPKWQRKAAEAAPSAEIATPLESNQATSSAAPVEQDGKPLRIAHFLGAIEAFIILGSVDILFAFFVAVQFRYLFGGPANITSAGYTFSEYARRGFFELVMVAVISLLLYLVLNAITRRATTRQANTFSGLSVALVGLVLVILVSAFQRLLLYENAYGFTSQRTYTHIFIPWLGLLLVGTIVLQLLRREAYFGALLLFTVAGFGLTFGFLNVDGLIVRQNVARARAGAELDGAYLLTLSDDALPALVQAYTSSDLPEPARDQLGAVLACRTYALSKEQSTSWQSYHPASQLARQHLAGLDLSAYPIQHGERNSVTLDSGSFSCDTYRWID